jgi:hypothetical protein
VSLATVCTSYLLSGQHQQKPLGRILVVACLSCRLDLRDIRVVCKVGGTIDDSELVDGCVFDQKVREGTPADSACFTFDAVSDFEHYNLAPHRRVVRSVRFKKPCRRVRAYGWALTGMLHWYGRLCGLERDTRVRPAATRSEWQSKAIAEADS